MKLQKKFWLVAVLPLLILSVLFIACGPEGTDDTDPRTKYLGNWVCAETQTGGGNSSFPVTVTNDVGNASRIFISNFNNIAANAKPYAVVTGNSLSIPQQIVSLGANDNYTISGSGSFNTTAQTISLTYTVNDGVTAASFTATLTP